VLKGDIAVLVESTKKQLDYILHGSDKFDAVIELKLGENDGTAILFDKARFTLIGQQAARLTPYGGQIVFNVILLDSHSQKLLCVTGLHLKSGDAKEMEDRRKIELAEAVKITDRFKADYGGDNIAHVISGDLNSDFYRYKDCFTILTQNGYQNIGSVKPTYYFWQKSIYDYIFIKGSLRAGGYDVDTVYGICPNSQQGSDHLAVRCNLFIHP
jgi:endonuclease/exonuclease/phosphatase family metal-dependent hydrolase